jgi:hypothetical protein
MHDRKRHSAIRRATSESFDADRIIAFPAADRTGGTEDTIRRAVRAAKLELR